VKIAVIPARGGSKRIPRKNIKDFCGKPMIAWSIEAALQSGCFDQVVVSTDDQEIAETAKAFGATVPFMRPAELADDFTGTVSVIQHAIRFFQSGQHTLQEVCCLYPTAPLLLPEFLVQGLQRMQETQSDFCFSVAGYGHPIQRALKLDERAGVAMFYQEHSLTRSQDLEPAFHDAGQFCWGTAQAFLGGVSPMLSKSSALVLPRHRVVDIDTPEDWQMAEALHKALLMGDSR